MSQVTREHARDILAHAHLTPEQERDIPAVSYPADIEQVVAVFARYGVTRGLAEQSARRESVNNVR